MKKIYLDTDFICHLEDAEGRTEIQTDAFDGMCDAYICGCRYVPSGQVWTRPIDGKMFAGEFRMAVSESALDAQRAYEQAKEEDNETIAGLMDDIEDLCNELIER